MVRIHLGVFQLVTFFGVTLVICGLMVISSLNSVHSVLWLIGSFTISIVIFIVLEVDFIALMFLIVYVGAIAILFLFVLMMLNFTSCSGLFDMSTYMFAVFLVVVVLVLEVLMYFSWCFRYLSWGIVYLRWDFLDKLGNIHALGFVLYTDYYEFFLLSSFLLLVSLMGAIILTFGVRHEMKRQEIFIQISR